jgi:hypothetical protein
VTIDAETARDARMERFRRRRVAFTITVLG